MTEAKTVLVVGATGKQGGAVVRALTKTGYKVRALTRNPSSKTAIGLHNSGVEIAVGDTTHEDSLADALRGVDIVFAMIAPFHSDHENEVSQGVNVVEAAKAAGINHLVFSSVASADKSTGIPHFETKYRVERYIVESEIPHTIIGPTAFMENFIQPFALPNLANGKIARGLPASRTVQLIAIEDIGSFAAFVIEHRDSFLGKRIDIAGDELTGVETAAILSKVIGKPIKYEAFPPDNLMAQNPDLAIMLKWQEKNNYAADIKSLRKNFPEIRWHTFEEWARAVDWKRVLASAMV
jgi:uncharacterized protein YbjT (DUF2867 family)